MVSLSKLTPLLPLQISAAFLSEFVAVFSSDCPPVLSPVFVAMCAFELFLVTSLELSAACLSDLVVMFLLSTEF